ncbi:hypothetical protein [Plantactinospora sp. B5E13]|uniref:hypothetical protein n=1 Tax=unclassified Plantactinospora TaxID=2631981 RepID=UPI00325E3722
MRELFRQELRGLLRRWPLWILPPLVAVVGLAMLPVNADAYMSYIYQDPQGPGQQLAAYEADVRAVCTSGLGWAQLVALTVGGFLLVGEPRLRTRSTARRSMPPATPPALPDDPGPLMVAKAAVAALFGLILAVVDLAVVLPYARPYVANHWVPDNLRRSGVEVRELTLTSPSVIATVLCAAAGVALFAVIGLGLAALLGRRWAAVGGLAVLTCAVSYAVQNWLAGLGGLAESVGTALLIGATLLTAPWWLYWYVSLTAWVPLAALLALIMAVFVFVLGYDATRRRMARAGAAPPTPR